MTVVAGADRKFGGNPLKKMTINHLKKIRVGKESFSSFLRNGKKNKSRAGSAKAPPYELLEAVGELHGVRCGKGKRNEGKKPETDFQPPTRSRGKTYNKEWIKEQSPVETCFTPYGARHPRRRKTGNGGETFTRAKRDLANKIVV